MTTELENSAQTVAVPPHEAAASPNLLQVSKQLIGWTWVTFILMTLILYKVAWKPILKALDLREEKIRRALADAERARVAAEEAEAQRARTMAETGAQAKQLLDAARNEATATAQGIEKRAHAESSAMLDNARREIDAATERARAALRRESVELAVAMAEKVLGENVDAAKNQALTDRLMKEL